MCVCVCVCVCVRGTLLFFLFHSRFSQPVLFESCLTKESESESKIYCNEWKHLLSNKSPTIICLGGRGEGEEAVKDTVTSPDQHGRGLATQAKKIEMRPFCAKKVSNRRIPKDLVTPLNHKTCNHWKSVYCVRKSLTRTDSDSFWEIQSELKVAKKEKRG